MQSLSLNRGEERNSANVLWAVLFALVAIWAFMVLAGPAFAGADTTFDTAFTKFSGYFEGSGGKVIAVLSLVGGVIAMAAGGFRLGQVAIPVGVGVAIGTGVQIVTSTVTALI